MRKFLILLLVLALLIPWAVAAEYDGMTIIHRAWYEDGTEHVIAASSSGEPYYYVNGVLTKGAGLLFIDGFYYYVRTDGNLAYNRNYWTATNNGLLPVDGYDFDSNGRMVNPPYLPDGWETVWFDSDPTIIPPSDPTEPTDDPNYPDALPTIPPDAPISPGVNFVPSILSICYRIISVPASWLFSLMFGSGMLGIYQASFLLFMLYRFLLSPILGHSGSDTSKRTRDKKED